MKKAIKFTFKITFIASLLFLFTCTQDELLKVTKLEIGSESAVTETTANVVATFIDVGANVIAFGFCYATSSTPTVSDKKTVNSGTAKKGDYSGNLTGLTPNTKYYVRAYALEGDKAVYSNGEVSFTTVSISPESPSVTTGLISDIQYSTVSCSGEVTNGGTETVTERGICWSTSQNPTVSDSYRDDGLGGIGVFSVDITGLNENTIYYVRAYAINSVNTSYGEQDDFTTKDPPVVEANTFTPSYITASGGGVVTYFGSGVDSKGVCWSTSQNPTINDNKTTDGSGVGSFISDLDNLEIGVTYYVRAYATNTFGTVYSSNTESFTTLSTVFDYDVNEYNVVKIGNQIWMAENLKVTHYPNGDAIPNVTDDTEWMNLDDINTDDAYCYYNNTNWSASTYGALYTYSAAIADNWVRDNTANQGICPDGWHLPSDDDWKELEIYLGMSQSEADVVGFRGTNEGSKLAGNTGLWTDGALDANANFGTSSFSALPGGLRSYYNGTFGDIESYGYWWLATQSSDSHAWYRDLAYDNSEVYRYPIFKSIGFSVRCLRN